MAYIIVIASTKCWWFECLLCWLVQNQVFYGTGFFFGWGGFCVFERSTGNFRWPRSQSGIS